MMTLNADAVVEIARNVWDSVLGPDDPLVTADASSADEALVTGCVTVSGGWEGAVAVGCSSALARRLTGAMFETEPDVASSSEVADAIGELANMIGGNIKGLMPGPSALSLPAVTVRESGLLIPGCMLLVNQSFQLGGERMRVQVLQRAAAGNQAEQRQ